MATSHSLSGLTGYSEVPTRPSSIPQKLLRFFQFLSSTISMGLFSARLNKILSQYHQTTAAQAAVQGILAAAVVYSIFTISVIFYIKGTRSWLRWLSVGLDVLFIGAFFAIAILTRPNGSGSAGPNGQSCQSTTLQPVVPKDLHCNLPYGTFALAILSALLYTTTALWQDYHPNFGLLRGRKLRERFATLHDSQTTRTSVDGRTVDNHSEHRGHADDIPIGYDQKHSRSDSGIFPTNSVTGMSEKQIESSYGCKNDSHSVLAKTGLGATAGVYANNLDRKSSTSVDQPGHTAATSGVLSSSPPKETTANFNKPQHRRTGSYRLTPNCTPMGHTRGAGSDASTYSSEIRREKAGKGTSIRTSRASCDSAGKTTKLASDGAILLGTSNYNATISGLSTAVKGLVIKEAGFEADKAVSKKKSLPGPTDWLVKPDHTESNEKAIASIPAGSFGYTSFPELPDRTLSRSTSPTSGLPKDADTTLVTRIPNIRNPQNLQPSFRAPSPALPRRFYGSTSSGSDSPTIGRPDYLNKFLGISRKNSNASSSNLSEVTKKEKEDSSRDGLPGYGTITSTTKRSSFGKPSRILSYSDGSVVRPAPGIYDHYPKTYVSEGTLRPSGRRSFYDNRSRKGGSDAGNVVAGNVDMEQIRYVGQVQSNFGQLSPGKSSLMEPFCDSVVTEPVGGGM